MELTTDGIEVETREERERRTAEAILAIGRGDPEEPAATVLSLVPRTQPKTDEETRGRLLAVLEGFRVAIQEGRIDGFYIAAVGRPKDGDGEPKLMVARSELRRVEHALVASVIQAELTDLLIADRRAVEDP